MKARLLPLVVAALFAAPLAHADEPIAPLVDTPPTGHVMTLDDCIASALAKNPDARSSDYAVKAQEEAWSGVRGELLPKLHADGTLQEWDRPFDLAFGPQTFRVREAFTWNTTVTVSEPLTGLFNVFDRYKVEKLGVDVAEIRRLVTRRDLAFRVAETYLRLLEAKRLEEVAKASVAQLEAQRKQAASLLANGVIGKNDELRAELALANARQREIQARGQIIVTRGMLASLIGAPSDQDLEAAPIGSETPNVEATTVSAVEKDAVAHRLELRALEQRVDQEDARVATQRTRLFPQVSAVGSYLHVAGSAFQQEDSAFVGLVGSWDVWDWGTTTSGIGQAAAQREQAKYALLSAASTVRDEARKAYVDLETAKEALSVAKTALSQAEENYRIVTKRFEQAVGTSFDVVDAESLLTSARAQVEDAFYGLVIARLALQRATGSTTPRLH